MSKVTVNVSILQGRALPIPGLSCCLNDSSTSGQMATTDAQGLISCQFEANSRIRLSVYSKTGKAQETVGELELQGEEFAVQHFTAIVDLVKLDAETQAHPMGTQHQLFPDAYVPSRPTTRGDTGSNLEHPQGILPISGSDSQGNPLTKAQAKNAQLITLDNMKKMWPAVAKNQKKVALLQAVMDELNKNLTKYKLDTPLQKAHFFAQSMKETGALFELEECLIYSEHAAKTAFARVVQEPYSNSLKYCKPHVNQVEFGNWIYANKNGNGNHDTGDGYKYRGRGLLHITGKYNYSKFTSLYESTFRDAKAGDYLENPDLVSKSIKDSARAAIFFWIQSKAYDIATDASDHTVKLVSRLINGGDNGLPERIANFHLTHSVFR